MATLSVPFPAPTAAEDAELLHLACKGWGTDEEAIINILAHREYTQRRHIQLVYEELYKENFTKRLESELSGEFERAMYRWMYNPFDREAVVANLALNDNIDYNALIEIACVNSPKELLAMKQVYHGLYKHSLEEDVAAKTEGDFRKLLVPLLGTHRYGGDEIDTTLAKLEAGILRDVIEVQAFNHDEIIRIFSTRSKAQLNATFSSYKDMYETSITKALKSETPNELVAALRSVAKCIMNPHKYFAKVLHNALKEEGSDDDGLTRVIVMHAEKDLKDIKDRFFDRTNTTLEDAVAKGTSGHYKSFLLALIGN